MKIFIHIFYAFLILFVFSWLLFPSPVFAANWYNDAWQYRTKITFNNATQAENLTNFPVLVKLNSSRIDYAKTQNAGQDIRFTDSDGTTLLSYEIEKWDESGSSVVWVKIPQIDASSNTDYIYVYYGNTSAIDTQSSSSVWDSNYKAVWHLAESGNGTAGEYDDESSSNNDGRGGNGTVTAVPTVNSSGQIGNAQTFDGNDWIAANDTNFPFITTSRTVSTWLKPNAYDTTREGFIFGSDGCGARWETGVRAGGWIVIALSCGAVGTQDIPAAGNWIHVVSTFQGTTSDDIKIYINGQEKPIFYQAGGTIAVNTANTGNSEFGINPPRNGFFFTGSIDETRVENIVRSSAWIAAQYKSDVDTFNTFAGLETRPTAAELDSPIDYAYTNNERPTFRWKASPDASSTLSKYIFEIDNPNLGADQPSGDFRIDDIPVSGTSDIDTTKYTIHYENFTDGDQNNNYISVLTKSSTDWGSDTNDGRLREGIVHWKVITIDNGGADSASARTLFVDKTAPSIQHDQLSSTSDTSPTLSGKITDPLAGGDTSVTQTAYGPRVASGPKKVLITIDKKEAIYLLEENLQYTCNDSEITDNTLQTCDKYALFTYTPTLNYGTHTISITGLDQAGNTSSPTAYTLTIGTTGYIITSTPPTDTSTPEEVSIAPVSSPIEESVDSPEVTISIFDVLKNFFTTLKNNVIAFFVNPIQRLATSLRGTISNIFFVIGENMQDISDSAGLALVELGYMFVIEPLKITDVAVTSLTPTTATITWTTNHPANGKVNWGLQEGVYTLDMQTDKRTTHHEFVLTGLTPNTEYNYEVMSHNKNYVYDANRKFKTLKEE